jgi:hypothetical protein
MQITRPISIILNFGKILCNRYTKVPRHHLTNDDSEQKLLDLFRTLSEDDRTILIGKSLELKRSSTTITEREYKHQGKSYPLSGTEG